VETIAPQRDRAILTTGRLSSVVDVCRQKMWRKMCVTVTDTWDFAFHRGGYPVCRGHTRKCEVFAQIISEPTEHCSGLTGFEPA
jgi:hypothetical protein